MQIRTEQHNWQAAGKDQVSTCELEIATYSLNERLFRGLKALLIWWPLAALSALVPVVHFASVPGLTFLGLFLAIRRFLLQETAENAKGDCPQCSQTVTVPLGSSALNLPRWEFCPGCNARLQIR